MIPSGFEELARPQEFPSFGWYVCGLRYADPTHKTNWYLHDDGVVRDYCNNDQFPQSSGWFKSEDEAYHYAIAYYIKHEQSFPYIQEAMRAHANTNAVDEEDSCGSQVMEFI